MLENPVSPTMRLVDPAAFAWLDGSSATALQASRDLSVPQADGLMVLKVPALQLYKHASCTPSESWKGSQTISRCMNTVTEATVLSVTALMHRQTE